MSLLFKYDFKIKDNIALISKLTGPIKYEDIEIKFQKFKKKIPKRSLIFLFADNTVSSIVSYICSIKNDCIILILDINTSKKDILELFKSYKPSFIISSNNILNKFDFRKYKKITNLYSYIVLKTNYKNDYKYNKNICLLLSTSGSMGTKKFVKLSKENIKENTKSIIRYLKINSKDRTITNMSFAYSYMLSVINTHIEKGASIYLTQNSILNKEFWKEYYNNKITSFNGVPYIYKIILKLGLDKIYTSYLKTMTQAGGKLDDISIKKIIKFCKKKRVKFLTMYGQTEASPRISYLSWTNAFKKIGSIGKSIPGGEMWIQKKGKKITEPGVIGDLIYKGKNVSLGYSKNYKDLLRGDQNKGVLNTEDLAYFDLEGFFYIKGRKKRIVKLFGNRLDLNEIEERMSKNGQEIVCTGLEDELCVYYTNSNSKKKILSQIIKITKQNKNVFKMKPLIKFPRTVSGKIDYNKLDRNA